MIKSHHSTLAIAAAERIMRAAGSSLRHYMPTSQNEIVSECQALIDVSQGDLLDALNSLIELVPEPQLVSMGFESPPEHATQEDHALGYALHLARTAIAKAKGGL